MNIGHIIAANLKRLRMERNLSLGQLSEFCDVSKVMLSQIEKGDTNPTINTVWKIANGLKVPYTSLLEQQESCTAVIKRADIPIQTAVHAHYRVFLYYPNTPNRNFELFQIELDEGCCYTSLGHWEKSQEYIMVLAGALAVTVNGQQFELSVNDTIDFVASSEHRYCNIGEGMVKAAVINFYPA